MRQNEILDLYLYFFFVSPTVLNTVVDSLSDDSKKCLYAVMGTDLRSRNSVTRETMQRFHNSVLPCITRRLYTLKTFSLLDKDQRLKPFQKIIFRRIVQNKTRKTKEKEKKDSKPEIETLPITNDTSSTQKTELVPCKPYCSCCGMLAAMNDTKCTECGGKLIRSIETLIEPRPIVQPQKAEKKAIKSETEARLIEYFAKRLVNVDLFKHLSQIMPTSRAIFITLNHGDYDGCKCSPEQIARMFNVPLKDVIHELEKGYKKINGDVEIINNTGETKTGGYAVKPIKKDAK